MPTEFVTGMESGAACSGAMIFFAGAEIFGAGLLPPGLDLAIRPR